MAGLFPTHNCPDACTVVLSSSHRVTSDTRLAIARLKSNGLPVAPLLRRAGLTADLVADPESRLRVQSQIRLLDEAAIRPNCVRELRTLFHRCFLMEECTWATLLAPACWSMQLVGQ
jgi:hypothetical protein